MQNWLFFHRIGTFCILQWNSINPRSRQVVQGSRSGKGQEKIGTIRATIKAVTAQEAADEVLVVRIDIVPGTMANEAQRGRVTANRPEIIRHETLAEDHGSADRRGENWTLVLHHIRDGRTERANQQRMRSRNSRLNNCQH